MTYTISPFLSPQLDLYPFSVTKPIPMPAMTTTRIMVFYGMELYTNLTSLSVFVKIFINIKIFEQFLFFIVINYEKGFVGGKRRDFGAKK
jgi:hypothetical protein